VRFETGPGEQAQVDYGQLRVWIGAQPEKVHLFVMTLGYSRRLYAHAYRHERLTTLLDGHERAFRWFGGVTLTCLYDNPRNLVLGRREHKVLWHPQFEDLARYYGFAPRACQPYRARTKARSKAASSMSNATGSRAGASPHGRISTIGWNAGASRSPIGGFTGRLTNGRRIALPANNLRRSERGCRIVTSGSSSAGSPMMPW